jgi:transcriptional regulator with XRE-family HTH domain
VLAGLDASIFVLAPTPGRAAATREAERAQRAHLLELRARGRREEIPSVRCDFPCEHFAALAGQIGIGASAVAQWELPNGTSPTVDHLEEIAMVCGVAFEWLATGRGAVVSGVQEAPVLMGTQLAADQTEDRLLMAFRRIPLRKRESLVRWMEEFF